MLNYKEKRKELYPTFEEQLDMLYWDKKNGTANWEAFIDIVKETNPKPLPEKSVTKPL